MDEGRLGFSSLRLENGGRRYDERRTEGLGLGQEGFNGGNGRKVWLL